MNKICPVCGKQFNNKNSSVKYCCRKCFYAGIKSQFANITRICANPDCKKSFSPRSNNHQFHDWKCYLSYKKAHQVKKEPKPRVICNCLWCKSEFELRNNGTFQTQKYCSASNCGSLFRSMRDKINNKYCFAENNEKRLELLKRLEREGKNFVM